MKTEFKRLLKSYSDEAYKLNGHKVLIDSRFDIVARKAEKHAMAFSEWLLSYCDTGIDDYDMKWVVMVETHVKELMTTKQVYEYWYVNYCKD